MENQPTYAYGALLNSNDNRDIHIADVLTAVGIVAPKHPAKNITDISVLPVENQKDKGTCVGQAEGKGEEYRDYKETGKFTRVSKRFIYDQSKAKDGSPTQGTFPRVTAGILKDTGACAEALVPDNNDLPYNEYLAIEVTDAIKTDASLRRVSGYAFCYTLEDVKNAIDLQGVLNITVQVGDWSKMPMKPVPAGGLHRMLCYGYEDADNNGKSDTKVYVRNSWDVTWGDNGNGWFWWSEYANFVYDMIVYTDMPNTLIDYAKAQTFKFTRVLHIGMTGTDVTELQKRLAKEIATDGKPCYQYGTFTSYFGTNTEDAVKRYQSTHGLVSSGNYKTTGYGQIGPKTMAMLNNGSPTISRLEAWADAIQQHEGWYVGSRSYRNNNPGNIKYVGQALAIGKDSAGFCIFKSYADGRKCLTDMLVRAATPPPEGYYPEMTLRQFFAKYAPSSDNNDPDAYAKFVAQKTGVTVDTPISQLI